METPKANSVELTPAAGTAALLEDLPVVLPEACADPGAPEVNVGTTSVENVAGQRSHPTTV